MAEPAIGLSKRDLFRALSLLIGRDYYAEILTTADGQSQGEDFIDASKNGWSQDSRTHWYALVDSLPDDGDPDLLATYREIQTVSGTPPQTFTLAEPFDAQIKEGTGLALTTWPPSLLTTALNLAIARVFPAVYWAGFNDELTAKAQSEIQQYDLPSGITWDMVWKVEQEGSGSYAGIPYYPAPQGSITPVPGDNTKIWIDRLTAQRPFNPTPGKILYLWLQRYLKPLDLDTTWQQLAHYELADGETGVVLTENTGPWNLVLLYARAALFEMLAASPYIQNAAQTLQLATAFKQMAESAMSQQQYRMPRLESPQAENTI